ncbi:MAG: T9SS type A sorting domain-containing protein, partial [Bacteroidales bacterium]|nr:T9SS type A sorting domain-containing protein [Bacteroidales bacterium]
VGVEEHYSKPIMNVFPNPATEYVNIDFSTNEEMNGVVAIIDMLGRTCKTQHAEGQTCKISVSDVPTGMYIITYTDKNRKVTKKFLKK